LRRSSHPSLRLRQLNPGCAIKGNISISGERIYHLPGQQLIGLAQWQCKSHTADWWKAHNELNGDDQ
jgi:hypothetical protein